MSVMDGLWIDAFHITAYKRLGIFEEDLRGLFDTKMEGVSSMFKKVNNNNGGEMK